MTLSLIDIQHQRLEKCPLYACYNALLAMCLYVLPEHLSTWASDKHWWTYNIPKGKRLSCHAPFQKQFIENSEKLNNLPRLYKESRGDLCLLSPDPVSQDSLPWQPEPALTGTETDPCPDLQYWITVKSKPAGTKLLFHLDFDWFE